jgi:centromere protein I
VVQSTFSTTSSHYSGFSLARNAAGKKIQVIPEVHTFHAQEATVTLEDIDSVEVFVDRLERIEPPSQVIAGLQDALVQKYLHLNKTPDSIRRLEFWLDRSFDEEIELIEQAFGVSPTLRELLLALLSYTEYTKQLHPTAERFLMTYLPLWDGQSNLGILLDLISYVSPTNSFKDLHKAVLSPLEKAIIQGATDPYPTLFNFYATLHPRWLTLLSFAPSNSARALQTSIDELNTYVATLALAAILQSPAAAPSILAYYHTTTHALFASLLNSPAQLALPLLLPPPELLYLLLFVPDPAVMSTTTALLAELKGLLETLISSNRNIPQDMPAILNALLMDAVNLLWRSRGFVRGDANAAACLQSDVAIEAWREYIETLELVDVNLAGLFGVSWNPATGSLAKEAWAEKGIHSDGPVGMRDVDIGVDWKTYRVGVLGWMEIRGLSGPKRLVSSVVKNAFT